MTKLIKKLIYLFFSVSIGWCGIVWSSPPRYMESYMAIMNEQYQKLENATSPKIVIAGGSNVAFGVNSLKIEKELGIPVCNLSTHAGLGIVFYAETVKHHLNAGDVILFIPEYTVYNKNIDLSLALEVIENNAAYYRSIPLNKQGELFFLQSSFLWKNSWNYLAGFKKHDYTANVYSKKSFDKNGNLKLHRAKNTMPDFWSKKVINIDSNSIDVEFAKYIKDFVAYANNKGARVVWSFPSVNNKAVQATEEEKLRFAKKIKEDLNVEIISDINDYILPSELFYDTDYHLNDRGMKLRTELLTRDLKIYLDKKTL